MPETTHIEETWLDREALAEAVYKRVLPAGVVLDIGCGIKPQRFVQPTVHICCEPFEGYHAELGELLDRRAVHGIILKATWQQAVELLPPRSVDTVFLLDVIEHLEKDESARLLERTVALARQQVVIFTPLGFMPQTFEGDKDIWGHEGTSWQEHRCGWEPSDFDPSWAIVGSKVFHTEDPFGKTLAKPFGAFYAIKTISHAAGARGSIAAMKVHKAVDKLFHLLGR